MTKQYDNFADLITFTRASTGTYLDSDGLLKTATTNTPRIEFDINGNRKGILIEEARTNLFPNSVPATATWTEVRATLEENSVASPDGGVNASKLVEDTTASATHAALFGVSVVSGTSYTFSVFAKAAERSQVNLNMVGRFAAGSSALFDLISETAVAGIGASSADLKPVGNGWYRCSVTATATSTGTQNFILYSAVSGDISYTGDGTSGVFVWGAQIEAGSFPTSYIPTAGSTATRAADVASIPTSAFGYNADKGTVVVDFEFSNYVSGTRRLFSLNTNFQNRMDGLMVSNGQFQQFVFDGSVSQVSTNTANGITNNEPSKAAAVYALNDFASVLDGGDIQTDTSGTVPSVNTLSIGTSPVNNWTNGHIKSLAYYPRKLTPAQLQRLTS